VIPGYDAWTNVPILNWNRHNRKVNLNANWDDNHNWNYALPVRRDYSRSKRGANSRPVYLINLSQPPSIRPISCNCDSSSR